MPCLGRGAQFLRVRVSLQDVELSPITLKGWPELWRIPQLSKDGRQRFINRLKQPPLTQRFTMPLSVFPYSTRALAQPRGRSPLGRCHAAQCIAAQRPQCTGRRTNRNRRTGILRESHAAAAPRADCPGELSQGRTEWALGGFGEFGSSWRRPASLRLDLVKPRSRGSGSKETARHMVAQPLSLVISRRSPTRHPRIGRIHKPSRQDP